MNRYLKTGNICYELFSKNKFIKSINIIYFGLATYFVSKKEKNYLPKHINHFVGRLTFVSTTALEILQQNLKDELESLFYT